jgi:hypothetical protein
MPYAAPLLTPPKSDGVDHLTISVVQENSRTGVESQSLSILERSFAAKGAAQDNNAVWI